VASAETQTRGLSNQSCFTTTHGVFCVKVYVLYAMMY